MIGLVLTLGIETATAVGGVALVHQDWHLELTVPAGKGKGELFPEAIDTLFRLAGVERRELELVAVDVGPGSFTSLRVGLALAKGVAQALGVPLVGVGQAEVLAQPVRWWPGPLWVWIHDRREYVFAIPTVEGRPGSVLALSWKEALEKIRRPEEALVVGSGAWKFARELQAAAPGLHLGGEALAYPRPWEVARLGQAKFRERGPEDVVQLEPLYVHKEV